jgi:hypothetical protein
MQRRVAVWTVLLVLVAVPWGLNARASHLDASKLAISAHLSATEVQTGDVLTITVQTVKGAHLVLHVTYPEAGGFKKKGKVDKNGNWAHSWIVNAHTTGDAAAQLLVMQGSKHRYYTLHFAIVGPATDTPTVTPTATATNTVVPTATRTATITPTATQTGTPTGALITASVDKSTPLTTDSVTVSARLTINNTPIAFATLSSTWHFQTGDQSCTGTTLTNNNGTAFCTIGFINEPVGITVKIDVKFTTQTNQVYTKTSAAQFTPSPGPTATPTVTKTITPTPSITPTITLTPTITPTPTATVQPFSISAGVDQSNPQQNATVKVTGVFKTGNSGVPGATMSTVWHFQSGAQSCSSSDPATISPPVPAGSGATNSAGTAFCSLYIGSAAHSFTVKIDVTFTYNGQPHTVPNATEFTTQ